MYLTGAICGAVLLVIVFIAVADKCPVNILFYYYYFGLYANFSLLRIYLKKKNLFAEFT